MPRARLPYPGLRPFLREESDLFFGRDGCVDTMVDRLAATRFLAVLGASGSGKSSLVYTGLLDALALGLLAGAGAGWVTATMRPGNRPMGNLAHALLAAKSSPSDEPPATEDAEMLASFLRRGPLSLSEWCREGNLPPRTNLLVLVDQFEELFRYRDYAGREAAERFVALLLACSRTADVPIYVTITMRSEYLGACALIPGLAEQINAGLYLTPRMSREEIRQAITGPASVCGFQIENSLVNQLLNDLSRLAPWEDDRDSDQLQRLSRRADQLPLMQHVLNRMWLGASARGGPVTLTVQDYADAGGLVGALDTHAGEVLDGLPEDCRPLVEPVFRALVAGGSIADAVRRPCRFDEIVALAGGREDEVRRVIDEFRDSKCNFLQPSRTVPLHQATVVDISHESLIREWPLLSQWMIAEARAAASWRRLSAAASAHARGEGDLLHGLDLANFRDWWDRERPRGAWAKRYGGGWDEAERYLQASKTADRAQRTRERKRDRLFKGALLGTVFLLAGLLWLGWTTNDRLERRRNELEAANLRWREANAALISAIQEREKQRQEMERQRLAAEDNRHTAFNLLNAIVEVVGADRNFFGVGMDVVQRDLLNKTREDLLKLVQSQPEDRTLERIRTRAAFMDARLAIRVSAPDAVKALAPFFADLAERYRKRPPDGPELVDFVTAGVLLAQLQQSLGDGPGAKRIIEQLDQVLPPETGLELENKPADLVEAYVWALRGHYLVPSGQPETNRVLVQGAVGAAEILVRLRPSEPNALWLKSATLCDWAGVLENSGKGEQADAAIAEANLAAQSAHDRDPSNVQFLQGLVRTFEMAADRSRERRDLAGAETAWETAYGLLEPALALAPNDGFLNRSASYVLTSLIKILRDQKESMGSSTWLDKLLELSLRRLLANPLDPAVAGEAEAAVREANSGYWRATGSLVRHCVAAATQELALSEQYPSATVHRRLLAGAGACALSAEDQLGEPADRRVADPFISANADRLASIFGGTVIGPEPDASFPYRAIVILKRASSLASERQDFARADQYAAVLIDTLRRLHPSYDYDYLTMIGLSDALRSLADDKAKQGKPEEAATYYRLCADPEQVPYPETRCMEALAKLIEAGTLRPLDDQEAAALRARMSVYLRKPFSLASMLPGYPNRTDYIVLTQPPKGFAGIDNWVLYLSRFRSLTVPLGTALQFRELDRTARTMQVPFPLLAVRTMGTAGSREDKAELDAITQQLKDGQDDAGFDAAGAFYAAARPGDTDGERRAAIIVSFADAIAHRAALADPTPAVALLARLRPIVGADREGGPTSIRAAWARALEQAGAALARLNAKDAAVPPLRLIIEEAVVVRRDLFGLDQGPTANKEPLAKDFYWLALTQSESNEFAAAAANAAASVALYRELASEDPGGAAGRSSHFAAALVVLAKSLQNSGQPEAAKPIASEALALQQRLVEQERCNVPATDSYISALRTLFLDAEDAHDWRGGLAAVREQAGVVRMVAACNPRRQGELASALGSVSWAALFTRDWAAAWAAADEALAIDPSLLWVETNAAHAHMLGGDIEGARQRYLGHAGKQIPGQGSWRDVILADFRTLRAAGVEHPLMGEIEAAFAKLE